MRRAVGTALILVVVAGVVYAYTAYTSLVAVYTFTFGSLVYREEIKTPPTIPVTEIPPVPMYFVGDIMLARDVENHFDRNGLHHPFSGFNYATGSIVVGNFESSVPVRHTPTPSGAFRFSVDEAVLPYMRESGVTHVSLANNHAYDFGSDGYIHTQEKLSEVGIVSFGHPTKVSSSTSITYIQNNQKNIALVGLQTLFYAPTYQEIEDVMTEAIQNSDIQIVYIHWGDEYVDTPNSSQRELAKTLADQGADIVVGHHPHVVQSIEYVGDTLVFYSLGNFIFDQYFSEEVMEGLVLRLDTTDTAITISLLPVETKSKRTVPQSMDASARAIFLKRVASFSSSALTEEIVRGELLYAF